MPWLVGYLLERRVPLRLLPAPLVSVASGAGIVLATLALSGLAWALSRFVLARTSVLPHRPASTFVVSGPYRVSRNPMYVSMATLHLGTALVLNSAWVAAGVPLGVALMQRLVIRREEAYLAARFGAAYLEYQRRVRRWL